MATNDDIVISKGDLSVTLFTVDGTAENIKNVLKVIASSGGTSNSNQEDGAKETKIVDLLRITESYHIEGYIHDSATKTAKQIKDDLKSIVNGAGINGGEISIVYEDTTITGYIEDLTIKKVINDDVAGSGYTGKDSADYRVTLEFIKGVRI